MKEPSRRATSIGRASEEAQPTHRLTERRRERKRSGSFDSLLVANHRVSPRRASTLARLDPTTRIVDEIPASADRVDQGCFAGMGELAAQVAEVNVEAIRGRHGTGARAREV